MYSFRAHQISTLIFRRIDAIIDIKISIQSRKDRELGTGRS